MAIIAIVVVSGYMVLYGADTDMILDAAYAAHVMLSLVPTDNVTDDSGFILGDASDIAIFRTGSHTYAAVTSYDDDGVQILDVTDPDNITAAGSIDDANLDLAGAWGIDTFSTGGHTYAAVAAHDDSSVQILDVTDPGNITGTDSIDDDANLDLAGGIGITTFSTGGHTYAAVAAYTDSGVQILDVTDPENITAAGKISDDASLNLNGATGITTFSTGGHIYAAVTASDGDNGVQILDVTDPENITAAGKISDDASLNLDNAWGIVTFRTGDHIYAAVAASVDDGVQILDVSDPDNIIAAGKISDDASLNLDAARGIAIFSTDGHTYAAVASAGDRGVQILDVSDPYNIIPAGKITESGSLELDGAEAITTFVTGGHTYAAVASPVDSGVQITAC